MYFIDGLSSATYQKQRLILPNGDPILLTIRYSPLQYGWFITEISYDPTDFVLQGARIVVGANMLYQWRNKIPFGLGCFTKNGQEPTQQEDFSSGFAKLFLLSEAEVTEFSEALSG